MEIAISDLLITPKHAVYHLDLKWGDLAPRVLLVGDPGRATSFSETLFEHTELHHEHRGLVSVTGKPHHQDALFSVVTTGMGTSSLEIVVHEIAALFRIDLATRSLRLDPEPLQMIRVGTSGALQADVELGTLIITEYAIGFDNTGLFLDAPFPDEFSEQLESSMTSVLQEIVPRSRRFSGAIRPYVAKADPDIVRKLEEACVELSLPYRKGITASASGFFINQNRVLFRDLRPTIPDLDQVLSEFNTGRADLRIENFEMEASYLLHFSSQARIASGSICPVIAHRRHQTFFPGYSQAVTQAGQVAINALSALP